MIVVNLKLLFLTTIGLTIIGVSLAQDCKEKTVRTCLNAFKDDETSSYALIEDLPQWTDNFDELNDRCLRFRQYKGCMDTVIEHCNSSDKYFMHGINDAYGFLCKNHEFMKEYLKYYSCYSNLTIRMKAKFCNSTYYQKLNTLPTESDEVRTQKYCTYTDNYLDCLTNTVKSLCEKPSEREKDDNDDDDDGSASDIGPAEWQRIWNKRLRQPLMYNRYGCPNWEYGDSSSVTIWTIILSVILGLTTLIMIIGIIVILLFVRQKKRYRRRAAIPPPPPYTMDPITAAEMNRQQSDQGEATNGSQNESVGMQSMARYPAQPPPYAGKVAPSYEGDEAAEGAIGGNVNPAFSGGSASDGDQASASASGGATNTSKRAKSDNKENSGTQAEKGKSSGKGNELYNNWF